MILKDTTDGNLPLGQRTWSDLMIDFFMLAFALVAAFEITAMGLIFAFREIMHSAVALALFFFANSLAFLLLNQPLLAVVQLLVLVGGVSTYVFVSVASASYSKFEHSRKAALAAVSLLLFVVIAYPILRSGLSGTAQTQQDYSSFPTYMYGSVEYVYLAFVLLAGTVLGSILLLKKVGAAR